MNIFKYDLKSPHSKGSSNKNTKVPIESFLYIKYFANKIITLLILQESLVPEFDYLLYIYIYIYNTNIENEMNNYKAAGKIE